MIRRPPRSTLSSSSAASEVYKRQGESQDICLVETQDMCCVKSKDMCFAQSQYNGCGLRPPPFVVSFVLALSKAHVLALNTAHVLRLNKADVLALNKAHVLKTTKRHLRDKCIGRDTWGTSERHLGRRGGFPKEHKMSPSVRSQGYPLIFMVSRGTQRQ